VTHRQPTAPRDAAPNAAKNLQAHPRAEVLADRARFAVTARRADPQEEATLWQEFAARNPGFDEYRNLTERPIPVVVLEPNGQA
jgi:deazaflavin-dependent oxidoreductase (nitroreductase family)